MDNFTVLEEMSAPQQYINTPHNLSFSPSEPKYYQQDPRMMVSHYNQYYQNNNAQNNMNSVNRHNRVEKIEPEKIGCSEILKHVSDCPICKSFYMCDYKYYWLIIGILLLVIFLQSSKR